MNKSVFIMFLSAALFVVACNNAAKPPVIVSNSQPSPAPKPSAGTDAHGHAEGKDAPRITLAEAKKDFDAKTAVFVDTHAPEQFAQRHIQGAINVPGNNMEPFLNKIPKGKKIIAYCSWADEHTSASLVSELKKKGFDNVYALQGGTRVWVEAGYPMETGKP